MDFQALADTLSLTEIVRLQDALSKALVRRFERPCALVFSDIVGSTTYFARNGNEAGRKLQQRHFDLLQGAIAPQGGRVVDTAGDGAFLAFPALPKATRAVVAFLEAIAADNEARTDEHRLAVRVGVHYGPVLTDGTIVSGDAVNFAARIAASAEPQEVRLSVAAWSELTDVELRLRCRRLGPQTLKGIAGAPELVILDWRDPGTFPSRVRLVDTREELALPAKDVIRFGRLAEREGEVGNDIVLSAADPTKLNRISRFHFELVRKPRRMVLRVVTNATTTVDGKVVGREEEVPVGPGTVIVAAGVSTVELLGSPPLGDQTLYTSS